MVLNESLVGNILHHGIDLSKKVIDSEQPKLAQVISLWIQQLVVFTIVERTNELEPAWNLHSRHAFVLDQLLKDALKLPREHLFHFEVDLHTLLGYVLDKFDRCLVKVDFFHL